MVGTPWNRLPPRARRLVVVVAAVDGALRLAALRDLARRPSSEFGGSRRRWAAALLLVNSAGVLPTVYFARRRT